MTWGETYLQGLLQHCAGVQAHRLPLLCHIVAELIFGISGKLVQAVDLRKQLIHCLLAFGGLAGSIAHIIADYFGVSANVEIGFAELSAIIVEVGLALFVDLCRQIGCE